jgi:soluble lytic murein transglycosylase
MEVPSRIVRVGGPFWPALIVLAIVTISLSCSSRPAPSPAPDLRPLLIATENPKAVSATNVQQLLESAGGLTEANPAWPVYMFLKGELHWLRREKAAARVSYQGLVEWAASDPNRDGLGGSALASVALWRWLQTLDSSSPDREEVGRQLDLAEKLRNKRLFRCLFTDPTLVTLPRLEEDILRRLALAAWSTGRQNEALRYLLDYLSIASTAELSPTEIQLKDQLIASGRVSPDRLALFRAKRLVALGMNDQARIMLTEAGESQDQQVRAEARLYLARVERIRGANRDKIVEILSSVVEDASDPEVVQQALLERARSLNREGVSRDVAAAVRDFSRLADSSPPTPMVDDALFELARYHQSIGELETALSDFERLRKLPEPNIWANQAVFQPAMILYTRGSPGDHSKAAELLNQLEKRLPDGPMHPNALFWLGRIAAEDGNQQQAKDYYERLVQEHPYNFYGIRARMHLHLGLPAKEEIRPDEQTIGDLRSAYQASKLDASMTGVTPYHRRLRGALETGLYARALAADRRLRETFPSRRPEELAVGELDDAGLLSPLVLWLALRQDAVVAKDASPSSANRLQIAGALGTDAQDWPIAIGLAMAAAESNKSQTLAQRDPRYLATAYPPVFREAIKRTGVAYNVRPELLYAIIRHESLFYTAALSPSGALGLFQFMPRTFNVLDNRWKLLGSSGRSSREAFLIDGDLSIDLGARYFQSEFLSRNKGNVLLALMGHNAGMPAAREWMEQLKKVGRENDIEFLVETIRFRETRVFVREVLASLAIAEAAGLFTATQ